MQLQTALAFDFETLGISSTTYSSAWTTSSPTFSRLWGAGSDYYYEAIRIEIINAASYTFTSTNDLDTYGYLYMHQFDPQSPSTNLVAYDTKSSGKQQFEFGASLSLNYKYYLVVTTAEPNVTGGLDLVVSGHTYVNMYGQNGECVWDISEFPSRRGIL